MANLISVSFARHVAEREISSMVSAIAAYGNVRDGSSEGEFLVEVFRPSKRAGLMTRLMEWERHGFLTYASGASSD